MCLVCPVSVYVFGVSLHLRNNREVSSVRSRSTCTGLAQ